MKSNTAWSSLVEMMGGPRDGELVPALGAPSIIVVGDGHYFAATQLDGDGKLQHVYQWRED